MTRVHNLKCKQCGYEWLPRSTSKPKCCPSCVSRKWDTEPEPKTEAPAVEAAEQEK